MLPPRTRDRRIERAHTEISGTTRTREVLAGLRAFVCADDGQDMVEYALLLVFISLACFLGIKQLGVAVNQKYMSVSASMTP
jgi:Flp pilus assembly pilin Flp